MATMIAELYDALIKAGADDASARSAAVAVADYDRRLVDVGQSLHRLETRLETGFAEVDARFAEARTESDARFNQVHLRFAGFVERLRCRKPACDQVEQKPLAHQTDIVLKLIAQATQTLLFVSLALELGIDLAQGDQQVLNADRFQQIFGHAELNGLLCIPELIMPAENDNLGLWQATADIPAQF